MRALLVAIMVIAGVCAAMSARSSDVATEVLVYQADFDGASLPTDWITYDGQRVRQSNVDIADSVVSLNVRPYNGEWRGASIILQTPYTYGRFVARVKLEAARYTKALALLWPATEVWPPEIDFLEIGDDNADRQKNTMTVHYDNDDKMLHRSYDADMTQWHNVSVAWRPDRVVFRLDGQVMPNSWGDLTSYVTNPGVDQPMKLHLTYWPTNKDTRSTPWPDKESKMLIDWVKIYA